MNDLDRWRKGNDDYLAAALAWLRTRLERAANHEPVPTAPTSPERKKEPPSFWQQLVKRPPTEAGSKAPLALAAPAENSGEQLEPTPAKPVTPTSAMDPPPALVVLEQRLGLSQFEQETLFLCAAMELDTRIASLCARAQDDPNRPYPTFGLALTLFDDPAWDALSPERPLRYWRLIEINQPGAQPLTTSALRADERIVNYIKGLNYLDDRLAPLLAPLDMIDDKVDLPLSQHAAVEAIVNRLRHGTQTHRLPVVQLLGPDGPSKQLVAQRAVAVLGLHLYRLPAGALPAQAAELETLARLWQRESMLLPIALYLDAYEGEGPAPVEGHAPPLHRFLSRIGGVTFIDTREIQTGPGWDQMKQVSLLVDIVKPTPAEQQAAWSAALGALAGDGPARLAGQFNLSLASIQQLAQSVVTGAPTEATSPERTLHDRLWEACQMNTRPRLDTLAQRLDAKATWDDIVLSGEAQDLLRQIAAQVGHRSKVYEDWGFHHKMNRGLGISALFTGESGTGKTMAAEVIANELRLNLYRIDLSAVVSKYIGETEKNLRRLFDAAEDGGAILFFDEADALFGKRSEVKDSHDRYANIEINYLLQRMEAYRGLAILATNMKSALDTAFVRRLRFIVTFPFPGPAERKLIWQKAFPPRTPTGALDFDRLARLNVTGGSIHNIALNAAFLAAQAGPEALVTMPLILEAARTEFRKEGKPINDSEFRVMEAVAAKS